MSDGPMLGRFRLSTWLIAEDRNTVYNGTQEEENPLSEETSIAVPMVSVDYRVTERFGLQALTVVPFIARTGVVQLPSGPFSFRDEIRGLGDTVAGAWYRGGSPMRWSYTAN